MPTRNTKKCANVECHNTFEAHYFGVMRTQTLGWFHQKNGDSWCPDHIPSWVSEWRSKNKSKEESE